MGKVPEYTKRAIEKYRSGKDQVLLYLPEGTKDRIRATGESLNAFCLRLILEELERIESQNGPGQG